MNFITVVALLGMFLPTCAAYAHNGLMAYIPHVDRAMDIDGNEDDWEWYDPRYRVDEDEIESWGGEINNPNDFRAYYYLAWEDNWDYSRLILFARVYDDTLRQEESAEDSEKENWFKDDALEIFIDVDHSGGPFGLDNYGDDEGQIYLMRFRPIVNPGLSGWDAISPYVGYYHFGPVNHWAKRQEFTQFASKVDTANGSYTYTYEIAITLFNTFEFYSPDDPSYEKDIHRIEDEQIIGLSVRFLDGEGGEYGLQDVFEIKGSRPEGSFNGDYLGDAQFAYCLDDWVAFHDSCTIVEMFDFPEESQEWSGEDDNGDEDGSNVEGTTWGRIKGFFVE